MAYIFIKYNIKKVKWYMLAIPMTVIWVISVGFSLPVAIRPTAPTNNIVVSEGFCQVNFESEEDFAARRLQFSILLTIVWVLEVVICGWITVTFSSLVVYFMKKTSLTEGPKRAIAKNLLFLSVDALLSIFIGVVLPTITLLTAPDPSDMDVQRGLIQAAVTDNIDVIILSLVSLYTPLVTIVLLKPVREAMKTLVVKCYQLYQ